MSLHIPSIQKQCAKCWSRTIESTSSQVVFHNLSLFSFYSRHLVCNVISRCSNLHIVLKKCKNIWFLPWKTATNETFLHQKMRLSFWQQNYGQRSSNQESKETLKIKSKTSYATFYWLMLKLQWTT